MLAGGCVGMFFGSVVSIDVEAEDAALQRAAGSGDLRVFRLDRRFGGVDRGSSLVRGGVALRTKTGGVAAMGRFGRRGNLGKGPGSSGTGHCERPLAP